MALPSDLTSVIVAGTYLDPAGAGLPGTITFTPSGQLTDTTGATVFPAFGKQYSVSAAGKFTTDALVATDNADITGPWSYHVTLALQNLPVTSWNVQLPAAPFSFTATSATPCVFTAAGSAYANGSAVKLTGGSLPAGFTAGTTYFVVSASGTSFSLAATSGGSAIVSTSTGSGTVSTASSDISSLSPVFTQLAALQYAELLLPTSVQSGSITAAAGQLVLVTTASGNATVTLPTGVEAGSQVGVKMVVLGGSNTVTISTSGTDKLNVAGGLTSMTLSMLGQGASFVYTGSLWVVESDDIPLAQLDTRYMANLTQTAAKTANYAAAANQLVRCDTSGGSFTVTLPTAPASGTLVGVKQVAVAGVGTNAVTVTCGGSDVFNAAGGVTSANLTLKGQSQLLEYASGIWEVVATDDGATSLANSRQGTWYLDSFTGTDDAKMTAALAALFTAGGGTIQLSPRAHTFASQWATTYSAGVATALKIQGAGAAWNGAWGTPTAATTCTFTYSGGGAACIDMQHIGTIEITGCQIKSANLGVPLFQTTNATPNLHDNVWSGGGSGFSCATDAIYLGGTGSSTGAGDTAKYNAYQGQVYRNFFDGIRRMVLFQVASNSIQVHDNTVSASCGSSLQLGACIEFNAPVSTTSGNALYGNCIEMGFYPVGVKLTQNAFSNTLGPNGFFDSSSPATIAFYYIAPTGNPANNVITDGFSNSATPLCTDLSFSGLNPVITPSQSAGRASRVAATTYWNAAAVPITLNGSNAGMAGSDVQGDLSWLASTVDAPGSFSQAQIVVAPCTQVTDGILVNGSSYVVSSTAAFAAADLYRALHGTGITNNRTCIMAAYSPTTAIPWAASTAYLAGDIARPTTSNGHLYQCTTAGTSGSSQPTFPTAGGTVTDGSAVWTDRGTTATAALMSNPCTSTATGVTVQFGRSAATVSMTAFDRHHILTSGTAPAGAADAGAGTGPSGVSTTGTDHAFTFSVTTGTATATGDMFHVNPANTWIGTPKFAMTAGNAATAALMAGGYWLTVSAGAVTANFVTAPATATAHVFSFTALV